MSAIHVVGHSRKWWESILFDPKLKSMPQIIWACHVGLRGLTSASGVSISGSEIAQAIVISYEGHKHEDLSTYISRLLHPLVPLVLFGRTAHAHPKTGKENVVYHWWKDI